MSMQMVTFSRQAICTSGRFIPPHRARAPLGIHHVNAQVMRTHHRRVLVVGSSSMASMPRPSISFASFSRAPIPCKAGLTVAP